jgi:DNA-binding protein YbaB
MSMDIGFSMDDAIAELRRKQERLQKIRHNLQAETTKVTSKDGMITVTLDGKGEITSIAFNTAKFRRMAPAELGAALAEVINRARAQSRDRVIGAYRSFMPEGMNIEDIAGGKTDINRMFDDAIRKGNSLLTDGRFADAEAKPGTAKAKEGPRHG